MPRPPNFLASLLAALLGAATAGAAADAPRVVVDIAPVRSLVMQVTEGVEMPAPGLLIRSGASPHDYAMRPSEAGMLAEADLVLVVGHALTPWLEKPLGSLASRAYVIELAEVPGLPLPPLPPGTDVTSASGAHAAVDAHLWLNPAVARIWLPVIADALAETDPPNSALYRENAEAAVARLAEQERDIEQRMRPLARRPYMVFHDAYGHFEHRFGLAHLDAVQHSDAGLPGAAHVSGLRDEITAGGVVCVFTEPQLSPAIARRLVEGTGAKLGVIDPLGSTLAPGPGLYAALIEAMAESFETCLAPGEME
ncbi:zinc ABC transporter substrate-binding protein [Oceanicella sp. SM1341]|uniref:zinc ABC transporter substrate-binding protein n=1 Tax=Oceanicella sp. SM1341 TaxID=1548889 RepID=UPI000E48ABF4|nr:zinc ABC transporter substrate-binding protein [Oceanicella sp. SM1341]